MNDAPTIFSGWTADPVTISAVLIAALVYGTFARARARWGWFAAAIAVVLVAELSPVRLLADGVLFSAHMVQHILLLLVAPALIVLSLPATEGRALRPNRSCENHSGSRSTRQPWRLSLLGWPAGVGAMWLWHVPLLCDAAIASPAVRALQTTSLLALGTLFWWPILASQPQQRLSPPAGIAYLFSACLACSALGMLITLTPIEVCSAFQAPPAVAEPWASLRSRLGALRDRQIGGLLMWVPMCLVYVSAIMLELARWLSGGQPGRVQEAAR